ncbi:hypothetical protein [Ahrensia marina]|uniref:Uncharacterized protein n=1 Tax=Ahrensia marina TaxID=1514904 RepID=A0A0M9GM70_9HYPH|nr:hypothetical protein [Ahrensia marina]KPB00749.1 hypothetical protein SU32_12090 [Ahrensia marina]
MVDEKRDTTVVKSGGSGGWIVAVLILLAVIGVGAYFYTGGGADGTQDVNISVDVPDAVEEAVPDAPAPDSN